MNFILASDIETYAEDMKAWRRDIHAHPETAYEEHRTSALVAAQLKRFGLDVDTGLGGTGVVGVLDHGDGPTIGLRADMDALFMQEHTGAEHASIFPGKMHACGHDGHTAMLLGAAQYLAERKPFQGRVVFIFQPAEEGEGGAKAMIDDGLFEKYPVDAVYGLHNWPSRSLGSFAIKAGPIMAAFDSFEAQITGQGTHGGMPHLGIDPIVIASQVITAWQSIVSRSIAPNAAGVISVTHIHGGDESYNVIPDKVVMKGAVRSFHVDVRERLLSQMTSLAEGICQGLGASFSLSLHRSYPSTVNSDTETGLAAMAASELVGHQNIDHHPEPSMGAEDFAFMLAENPGCYVWMGTGEGQGSSHLHNPQYDFNDDALTLGASYWIKLVENLLPQG